MNPPRSAADGDQHTGTAVQGREKRKKLNNDILIAFSVFQMTFLMLDIFILSKTDRNIARKDEYTWFYVLIGTHIAYLVLNNLEYAKKSVERKKEERYKACLDACNRLLLNYSETKYTKEVEKIAQDVKKQLSKYNKNTNQ